MWNPTVFPSNPEQWTGGLHVTTWSNGTVSAEPYGAEDGMTIGWEVATQSGQRLLRFPFSIHAFP